MEYLFSYGTLQLKQVQLDTFKRILKGQKDQLIGYKLDVVTITDPSVIESSGTDEHPILSYSGNHIDIVEGTVFEITEKELAQADKYEVDDYKRTKASFASGKSAWVYIQK